MSTNEPVTDENPSHDAAILTAACRFTGLNHEYCQRVIYFGSIFGEPSECECECHKEA